MTLVQRCEVLIVGGGHAGVAAAAALTKASYPGSITLIAREDALPYERPPLSKRMLADAEAADPVLLRSADYWAKSPVQLHRGESVVAVDATDRVAITDRDRTIYFHIMIWATGGNAARTGLPGEDVPGVHTLRESTDVPRLRSDLAYCARAVVVGGGYIGLEAAAALRAHSVPVTLIETGARLLSRVTGPVVSDFFAELHRAHGVDVRLSTRPLGYTSAQGRLSGLSLADGENLPASLAVVGVGMRPNVAPLVAAGALGDALGVDVDQDCRSSLPGVFVIGDCARQQSPWSGTGVAQRIESVHNAHHQAAVVANLISDQPRPAPAVPRFWSTQYGHELKSVGLPDPSDDVVVRGDPAAGTFSVCYVRAGALVAIDTVNRHRDFARAQGLIAAKWDIGTGSSLRDAGSDLPRLATPAPAAA